MVMKKSQILAALILGLTGVLPSTPAFADPVLYSNGSGDVGLAYLINYGEAITDSFTLSQNSTVTGADFAAWILTDPDTLSTVDYAITTAPLGGTTESSGTVSPVGSLTMVEGGWDYYEESFSIPNVDLSAGTYWLELQNAVEADGGIEVAWQVDNGPSGAFSSAYGNLNGLSTPGSNSEAFDIYGAANSATPEPSGIALLGSGLAMLAAQTRRKLRAKKQ
jgi:hypothetical protein